MITRFKQFLVNLIRREEGASALEYALLAAMVAVVIASFVPGISTQINTIFTKIQTTLTTANK